MKVHARELFSSAQREKIRQAVEAAESGTTGEISIVVVDESDQYREAAIGGAVMIAGFVSFVLSLAFDHTSIWFYVPATLILLIPSWYLFVLVPHLKRALLTKRRIDEAVREEAVYTFFRKGLHNTREGTGILIFISLLERKVWILADRAIHDKTRDDFWRKLTRELTEGIRQEKAFEALTSVLSQCSQELKCHFPGSHINRLPDDVTC